MSGNGGAHPMRINKNPDRTRTRKAAWLALLPAGTLIAGIGAAQDFLNTGGRFRGARPPDRNVSTL
jgi:hypothetical protein